MITYEIDQYKMQSYFETLCKSFMFAYKEVKRFESMEKELATTSKNEELQLSKEDYRKESKKLAEIKHYWADRMWDDVYIHIRKIIRDIKNMNFSIIITREEEIIALMAFYRDYSVLAYDIINIDPQHLLDFPKDKMSQEFLKAYCSYLEKHSEEEMRKVVKKYF